MSVTIRPTARWPLRLVTPTLSEPMRPPRRGAPALVAAVAGVVAIAAQRARAAGDLASLRDAIERALESAGDPGSEPPEAEAPDLPRIADADPLREAERLRALLAR